MYTRAVAATTAAAAAAVLQFLCSWSPDLFTGKSSNTTYSIVFITAAVSGSRPITLGTICSKSLDETNGGRG